MIRGGSPKEFLMHILSDQDYCNVEMFALRIVCSNHWLSYTCAL
jgi:hypothetical protein